MTLTHLWHALVRLFERVDGRLTDAAYLHGRYCVADGKIPPRRRAREARADG